MRLSLHVITMLNTTFIQLSAPNFSHFLLFKQEIRQFFDFFSDIFFEINISSHQQAIDLLVDSLRREVIVNLLSHHSFVDSFDLFESFSEINPEVFVQLVKQVTEQSVSLSLDLCFLAFDKFIESQILSIYDQFFCCFLQILLSLNHFPFFGVFCKRY